MYYNVKHGLFAFNDEEPAWYGMVLLPLKCQIGWFLSLHLCAVVHAGTTIQCRKGWGGLYPLLCLQVILQYTGFSKCQMLVCMSS